MAQVLRPSRPLSAPVFGFDDLERELAERRAAAVAEAQRIIAEARHEARQQAVAIREQARREGFEQGRREGREAIERQAREQIRQQTQQQWQAQLEALRRTTLELEQRKHALLAEAETGLVELAMAIARRVCKRLAERDPQVALENVRTLLARVAHEHDVVITVSREQFELVRELAEPLLAELAGCEHVQWQMDASLPPGSCRITTRSGELDATIETQLERIAEALLGADSA